MDGLYCNTAKVLTIENNSTAMYFDFKDEDNISRRQFIADRYMEISKKYRVRKGWP
jgi:hypothetical protein